MARGDPAWSRPVPSSRALRSMDPTVPEFAHFPNQRFRKVGMGRRIGNLVFGFAEEDRPDQPIPRRNQFFFSREANSCQSTVTLRLRCCRRSSDTNSLQALFPARLPEFQVPGTAVGGANPWALDPISPAILSAAGTVGFHLGGTVGRDRRHQRFGWADCSLDDLRAVSSQGHGLHRELSPMRYRLGHLCHG